MSDRWVYPFPQAMPAEAFVARPPREVGESPATVRDLPPLRIDRACAPLARLFDRAQPDPHSERQMAALCHRCPFFAQCRELALSDEKIPGYVAGMTVMQRAHARRRRTAA